MKLLRPWIAIALLAPMLVLAVSASSFIGLRCRMTGMISVATCCPAGDAAPAPVQSAVDAPGCCERIILETAMPNANTCGDAAGTLAAPPSTLVAAIAVAGPALLPGIARSIADADSPRVSRSPLRLLKQSFLI